MERNNFEGASNSSKLDFHEISTYEKMYNDPKKKYIETLHEIKMHP